MINNYVVLGQGIGLDLARSYSAKQYVSAINKSPHGFSLDVGLKNMEQRVIYRSSDLTSIKLVKQGIDQVFNLAKVGV